MVIHVAVDGRRTKLRAPAGCTMDQVGGLVVGGCAVKRRSDVRVRVEQVAHTEGRSSQSLAHRDYGRKLLQVVADLKRRLPDDRTPPKQPPPMRTLKRSAKPYPELPDLLFSPVSEGPPVEPFSPELTPRTRGRSENLAPRSWRRIVLPRGRRRRCQRGQKHRTTPL